MNVIKTCFVSSPLSSDFSTVSPFHVPNLFQFKYQYWVSTIVLLLVVRRGFAHFGYIIVVVVLFVLSIACIIAQIVDPSFYHVFYD